jgi:hypothetical protein
MFFHSGIVSNDSEDERAFMALNISITTRMESDMVEAVRVVVVDGANIEQSVVENSGDSGEHLWKWDYKSGLSKFFSQCSDKELTS